MKLPIINIKGYHVGYNFDDFEKDTYSIHKSFFIGGYKSALLYNANSRTIIIYCHTTKRSIKISADLFKDWGLCKLILSELLTS